MGPGGTIAEPVLNGDFTTAILWSRHLPEKAEELLETLAEVLPAAQVRIKEDSKKAMR